MTWLRLAASPQLAGIVALTAAASLGACHLIGGAGDLTFEEGVGGSGAGSTGTAGGGNEGLPLGSDCSEAPDGCASGFCVDGVCCDTACEGECSTCVASGNEGTCSPDIGASCGDTNICDGAGVCSTGDQEWALVGGSTGFDNAGTGAIFGESLRFVGSSDSPVTFTPLSLSGMGSERSFVGRIDDSPDGTIVPLGENDGVQRLELIARFSDGGYVVAGTATGSFDLAPVQNLTVTGPSREPVVIAFAADGTPQWGKAILADSTSPRPLALAVNDSQIAFAFSDETMSAARSRLVILSRDGGGKIEDMNWDLGNSMVQSGELTGLAFDPAGELWAAGWCVTQASIETGGSLIQVGPTQGRVVPILVHYDQTYDIPSGASVAISDGTGVNARLTAVSASEDTVYVAGSLGEGTLSQTAAEGESPVELVSDAMGEDPFVLALDTGGRAKWGRSFASTTAGIGVPGLAHDDARNVVIGGWLETGQVTFGQATISSGQSVSSFIAKMVPGGELAWARSDTNPDTEPIVKWVGIDGLGRTWATGRSTGSVFGASGIGDVDMWLLRLAP